MNKLTTALVGLAMLAVALSGCGASNKAAKLEKMDTAMAAEGYTIATIKYDGNSEAPCDYLILTEDMILEPTALGDEFKQRGLEVYVKYTMSRRPSICSGSQPIGITDIKKRGS